ncbi:MAG: hypothetical protein ACOZQL_38475 [Myxococcota bacterium]
MAAKRMKDENKMEATTSPVKDITELGAYWDRAFNLDGGYRAVAVEVVSRENNVITFNVIEVRSGKRLNKAASPLSVDLDDGTVVWSSLPSTAQMVDPESSQRIGYLFLTEAWIKEHIGQQQLKSGGKWPRVSSL